MTIKELNQELAEANEIILDWKTHNDDIEDIHLAIHAALEANREAIIQFLNELVDENEKEG